MPAERGAGNPVLPYYSVSTHCAEVDVEGVSRSETTTFVGAESATRRASEGTWTPSQRCYAPGPRQSRRSTAVLTMLVTIATLCTKMLSVDNQQGTMNVSPRRQALLQRLMRHKLRAQREAHQEELMFEPLYAIHSEKNSSKIFLQGPLVVDKSYKHYAVPRLPPLPTKRNEILEDARSLEQTMDRVGNEVIADTELEMQRVAKQMLVLKFQPAWLRGPPGGRKRAAKVHAVGGGILGGGNSSSLGRKLGGANNSALGSADSWDPVVSIKPFMPDGDPEIKEFMHAYRHGVQDQNSSVVQAIATADRIVTEPDDIVKMEDEVHRLHKERIVQSEAASHRNSTELPGVFQWFEDHDEESSANQSNLTFGTWVWCQNATSFAGVHWENRTLVGAPVMRPHQKFFEIEGCVSVDGPGFLDDEMENEEEEEAEKKRKIEEDEIAELEKRNWDEPFMTYEPHPSSVGWSKENWKLNDWVAWGITGPLLSTLFVAFVCWSFGWLPGVGVFVICAGIDCVIYYWNW